MGRSSKAPALVRRRPRGRGVPRSSPKQNELPGAWRPGKEETVGPEQTVSEMVAEVLGRRAEELAERTGRPLERAYEDVTKTAAGRQLGELAEGPHRNEKASDWQAGLLAERVSKERAKGEEAHAKYHTLLAEDLVRLDGETSVPSPRS